ncbi:MAG TPA: L,D-transpeptidase family protein [Rhizomicrobium sp.]|nr:L,D-transpeptidase family protein [Rhizomicrobium sp.]
MDFRVTADMSGDAPGAWLDWGEGPRRAAIGPGGIAHKTGEGDGITPRGAWPVRRVFYRADRIARPRTALPLRALAPDDGWCDAPDDPGYNRLVKLPYPASAERMWRDDHLYDLILVLGYNDDPVVPGKGSAIFLHLARPDYTATQGCVALKYEDALAVLERIAPGDRVVIG